MNVKKLLVSLVAVMALAVAATASSAFAAPVAPAPAQYCVLGQNVTATTLAQNVVYGLFAPDGGYWALPITVQGVNVPYFDQTPSPAQIAAAQLVFITVTRGPCPVFVDTDIDHDIWTYGDGNVLAMVVMDHRQNEYALGNGYRIPYALPVAGKGTDGGTYWQDVGLNWYELIGAVPAGFKLAGAGNGQYISPKAHAGGYDGVQFAGVGGNYLRLVKA